MLLPVTPDTSPIVLQDGYERKKNYATKKKAQAVLGPRDPFHSIAQMAITNSKVLQYERPFFTSQYREDTACDGGQGNHHYRPDPPVLSRVSANNSPSHETHAKSEQQHKGKHHGEVYAHPAMPEGSADLLLCHRGCFQ